jgi:FG-GAP-like repeat
MQTRPFRRLLPVAFAFVVCAPVTAAELRPLRYNNPGLVVDLGVGLWAWPLPMDFDGDGDPDLVVVCPDKPSNGTYVFENVSGNVKFPVFQPGRRISRGLQNVQVSYVAGEPVVMSPARSYPDFLKSGLEKPEKLKLPAKIGHKGKVRANQWKQVDFDGDGRLDLIVGIGDWSDYGWDDAWDKTGKWTNGPLHGNVYLLRNRGTNDKPAYDKPRKLTAGGKVIDVYGRPSPNFADFDGDGDLDLICGEFLDGFTYFENVGTRTKPRYAAGRRLVRNGKPVRMDLQMIAPVAFDWDKDGDMDLIVGDEDGRVALIENTGKLENGMPVFLPPRYFQQQAQDLKFGALATPTAIDWDGDGDQDILCGNTAGYIGFFENLGGSPPKWAAPRLLRAGTEARPLQGGGKTIRIQAGPNGSIQGPCEAKWGYTTLTAGDWDGDGLPDVMVNSIWGKVIWYRNVGTRRQPKLAAAQSVEVEWPGRPPKPAWNWWNPKGKELVTQWRTTPVMVDWNRDGLMDLVMLDHEGYLTLFERSVRNRKRGLLPGRRIFCEISGNPLRLNSGRAGKSGRRKIVVVDWDGDGKLDVLANSKNADWWQNMGVRNGRTILTNRGPLFPRNVAGHTSSPTVVDFNRDGVPELLVGAEDGRLYYAEQKRKDTAKESRP